VIQVDFSAKENINPDFYHNLVKQVDDLDIALVFANAGCFSLGPLGVIPTLYIEKMLDVNIYHFTMMHKVFLPWLI
jgi:NADP-dependent 3-hydroxy acid dehydrogenase YdfG